MRVFVTGAAGFIGSATVRELLAAGHQVIGLSRSDANEAALIAAGAQVHRGSLEDLESLKSGAARADGVLHTAFIHDFSKFAENCEIDRRAIEALGAALKGSGRPLIVTGGLASRAQGGPTTEDTELPTDARMPRVSEQVALALVPEGVRASVVRLPQVHDQFKQGLITYAVAVAREKGVSAYIEDGLNRWPAAPLADTARLYQLVLEKGIAGGRYHAVAEEGVPARQIAEAIGRGLKLPVVSKSPEEAGAHFGWLGFFMGLDMPASSAWTQQQLGWHPAGPGLIEDLDRMRYSES